MKTISISKYGNLEEAKKEYLDKIDKEAEKTRDKYVTPGSGQAMTYEIKYQEALKGAGTLLEMEALATGKSVKEVAASVIEARERWVQIGGFIESERIKAKEEVRQSLDKLEAMRKYKNFLSKLNM